MKRPTYILARFYYPGKEHPELKVAYIKNNLVFRWLIKYNCESITLPNVTKENLETAFPPFWGEMRRYALSIIYDTIS
jgi:hypothetical protein